MFVFYLMTDVKVAVYCLNSASGVKRIRRDECAKNSVNY